VKDALFFVRMESQAQIDKSCGDRHAEFFVGYATKSTVEVTFN